VSAAEYRDAYSIDVFLQCRGSNHFRCLAQTGVDNFHAGITQRAGDNFCASIVAVETRLRHQDADFSFVHGLHCSP
jgi:hypothetical protein